MPCIMSGTDEKNSYAVLPCHDAEPIPWPRLFCGPLSSRSCSSLPGGRCPLRAGVAGSTDTFLGQGYGRVCCVQRQVLAVTLLKTMEVSAVAVRRPAGQTSSEVWTKFSCFLRDGEPGSEVDFHCENLDFHEPLLSGSHLRVHTSATKAFGIISLIPREGGLVLGSILPAWFAHSIWTFFRRAF